MRLCRQTLLGAALLVAGVPDSHIHAASPGPDAQVVKEATTVANPANMGFEEIRSRLEKIETAVNARQTNNGSPYATAIAGLLGVLLGGLINGLIQAYVMKGQTTAARQLAENRAKLEIRSALAQWQLKQLSELYGPAHALLGQSKALYDQMTKVLADRDKEHFELKGGQLFIRIAGMDETHFRTALHIRTVYGKGYGVDQYFDEIVATGARIVKVIEEKAGYVLPEQHTLPAVFGQYLAHYAILQLLHSQVKNDTASTRENTSAVAASKQTTRIDESAVFPLELPAQISQGFTILTKALQEWGSKS